MARTLLQSKTTTPIKSVAAKASNLLKSRAMYSGITPSGTGSTVNVGALLSGDALSSTNAVMNPIGALSNVDSKTTGNTAISLDGAAFMPGATIAVGSSNNVQGAQQTTSNVLGGSNGSMISGFSAARAGVTSRLLPKTVAAPTSGVSNILNQTKGDFQFNLNGAGGTGGGIGSLILDNGTTVIGGTTSTGIVGGTTNTNTVSG